MPRNTARTHVLLPALAAAGGFSTILAPLAFAFAGAGADRVMQTTGN